jgi:hypothetical protein
MADPGVTKMIDGKVIDAITERPISGARVAFGWGEARTVAERSAWFKSEGVQVKAAHRLHSEWVSASTDQTGYFKMYVTAGFQTFQSDELYIQVEAQDYELLMFQWRKKPPLAKQGDENNKPLRIIRLTPSGGDPTKSVQVK